jgi:hypothetical protein
MFTALQIIRGTPSAESRQASAAGIGRDVAVVTAAKLTPSQDKPRQFRVARERLGRIEHLHRLAGEVDVNLFALGINPAAQLATAGHIYRRNMPSRVELAESSSLSWRRPLDHPTTLSHRGGRV